MFGGKEFTTKKGRKGVYLNPSQKGAKFATELKNKCKITNAGEVKLGKDNDVILLTDTEKAYRSGYLAAQKDSASLYNFKNGLKKRK